MTIASIVVRLCEAFLLMRAQFTGTIGSTLATGSIGETFDDSFEVIFLFSLLGLVISLALLTGPYADDMALAMLHSE